MTDVRPHSLALLVASIIPALTVVWSVDFFTPVLVGVPVVIALLMWLPAVVFPWTRAGLIVLAGIATSVTSLLYARPDGQIYVEWGLITISDGSFAIAIASFLRILAIAIPAILVVAVIEPHELIATAVVRRVVPQRVALASLVGLRLIPVIVADLGETRDARRAAGRSTNFWSLIITTLVIAIRRAIRMSEIADVRGFSRPDRVWTSYRPLTRSDWLLIGSALLVGIAALVLTAVMGEWNSAI